MHAKCAFLLLCSQVYGIATHPARLHLDQDPFDRVKEVLKIVEIINDVVDDFTPKCIVTLFYDNLAIEYGTHLEPFQIQEPPALQINCPSIHDTPGMTIILTDLETPSRATPEWSEVCHWIAIVPTSTSASSSRFLSHSLAIDLDELLEYKPPGPEKTGYHRYVFLLLEGNNSNLTKPEERQHWGFGEKGFGARDWARQEGLEVVGADFLLEENKRQ